MTADIPFNRPPRVPRELEYVQQAIETGHTSGDGPFTQRCSTLLEELTGTPKALLTTSCTHALEMAALLLDIGSGDEVIVPSFTFVSTANAFALRGARIVFVDVREDTLNLDEARLEDAVSDRTRAIVPVHYGGVACEMDTITELAKRYDLVVVEDNAHGLMGRYRGSPLGTFGAFATQSFHQTKNFSCGEGGALLVNDERFAQRAEIVREKGTDRARFFRGEIDKYTWVDLGSSYLPSDILAAVLAAQLEHADIIQARRKTLWGRYRTELSDWAAQREVQLPAVPDHCEQAFHLFYMLMPTVEGRTAFIRHLAESGVQSTFHYLPLHLSSFGQRFGGGLGSCPVAEDVSARIVRLPLYFQLTDDEQRQVIDAVRSWTSPSRSQTN